MLKRRLMATLAATAFAVASSLVFAAAPAQASLGHFTCTFTIETPWHSMPPLNNRVYFNSHVICTGVTPWTILLYNAGGVNGQLKDYENKTCHNSLTCYSTGGQTYVPYAGRAEYCGLGNTSISATNYVTLFLEGKKCVTL